MAHTTVPAARIMRGAESVHVECGQEPIDEDRAEHQEDSNPATRKVWEDVAQARIHGRGEAERAERGKRVPRAPLIPPKAWIPPKRTYAEHEQHEHDDAAPRVRTPSRRSAARAASAR